MEISNNHSINYVFTQSDIKKVQYLDSSSEEHNQSMVKNDEESFSLFFKNIFDETDIDQTFSETIDSFSNNLTESEKNTLRISFLSEMVHELDDPRYFEKDNNGYPVLRNDPQYPINKLNVSFSTSDEIIDYLSYKINKLYESDITFNSFSQNKGNKETYDNLNILLKDYKDNLKLKEEENKILLEQLTQQNKVQTFYK